MVVSNKKVDLLDLLGGGCFERDLVEQTHLVLEAGVAKKVFYDIRLSEEVIWGAWAATGQHAPTRIVASQYHHSVGVPALFPAECFPHLLSLNGDLDAKSVLIQFENSLLKIPLPEAELDIDCVADFDYLTAC